MDYKARPLALFLLLSATFCASASTPAHDPFGELVQSERDFAADGARDGIRSAFLAHMANDAMVYRPGPVGARGVYQARPESSGKLLWGPRYGAVSAAGDLGITTGPWHYVDPAKSEQPLGTGWFFSVWRRGPDGKFRWVLDHGVDTPSEPLAREATPLFAASGKARALAPPLADARLNALLGADRLLSDPRGGDDKTRLAQVLDPEALCLVSNAAPDRGCSHSAPDRLGLDRPRTLAALHLAASGDLAATSGFSAGDKPDTDVRAWRYVEGSGWRLIALVFVAGAP